MALTKCRNCGQMVDDTIYTCPRCGAPIENSAAVQSNNITSQLQQPGGIAQDEAQQQVIHPLQPSALDTPPQQPPVDEKRPERRQQGVQPAGQRRRQIGRKPRSNTRGTIEATLKDGGGNKSKGRMAMYAIITFVLAALLSLAIIYFVKEFKGQSGPPKPVIDSIAQPTEQQGIEPGTNRDHGRGHASSSASDDKRDGRDSRDDKDHRSSSRDKKADSDRGKDNGSNQQVLKPEQPANKDQRLSGNSTNNQGGSKSQDNIRSSKSGKIDLERDITLPPTKKYNPNSDR